MSLISYCCMPVRFCGYLSYSIIVALDHLQWNKEWHRISQIRKHVQDSSNLSKEWEAELKYQNVFIHRIVILSPQM